MYMNMRDYSSKVGRYRKSQKNRQHNGEKKKDKKQT